MENQSLLGNDQNDERPMPVPKEAVILPDRKLKSRQECASLITVGISAFDWTLTLILWYVRRAIFFLVCFLIIGVCIYYHLKWIRHGRNSDVKEMEERQQVIKTFCARIVPEKDNSSTLFFPGIPYGLLSEENKFDISIELLHFHACYEAYWLNTRAKNNFTNATMFLRFRRGNPFKGCPQRIAKIDRIIGDKLQECVTMSIRTPYKIDTLGNTSVTTKWPVIIFIGGRSFMESIVTAPSKKTSIEVNAIFVTISHRLSVVGFPNFHNNIEKVRPTEINLAVWDLRTAMTALKVWLPSMNADMNRIVLMGQGSGATLGLVTLVTPDLYTILSFKAAWLIGGSILTTPVEVLDGEPFKTFMGSANCSTFKADPVASKECLTKRSTEELLNTEPTEWRNVDDYLKELPRLGIKKHSLLNHFEKFVLNPYAVLKNSESAANFPDIPIVFHTRIMELPPHLNFSDAFSEAGMFPKNISDPLLFRSPKNYRWLESRVKYAMNTLQKPSSQLALDKELLSSYHALYKELDDLLDRNKLAAQSLFLGYERLHDQILSDMYFACPYHFAVSSLLRNRGGQSGGAVYRLMDLADSSRHPPDLAFTDPNNDNVTINLLCHMPLFLSDNYFYEKDEDAENDGYVEGQTPHCVQPLLDKMNFVGYVEELRAVLKQLAYQNLTHLTSASINGDKPLTDTFNYINLEGIHQTPDPRSAAMNQMCNKFFLNVREVEEITSKAMRVN